MIPHVSYATIMQERRDERSARWELVRVSLLLLLGVAGVAYNEADNARLDAAHQHQCDTRGC